MLLVFKFNSLFTENKIYIIKLLNTEGEEPTNNVYMNKNVITTP